MKLRVKPEQGTPGLCGPASLRMVLSFYGVDRSEAWLAEKAGARARAGTTEYGMLRAAKAAGFRAVEKKNASLLLLERSIRQGIPPIVGWWDCDTPHYSVLMGIDKRNVYLADPDGGKERKIPLWAWRRLWFSDKKSIRDCVLVFNNT